MKTRTVLLIVAAAVALGVAFVFTTNLKPPEGEAGIPKLSAAKNLAIFTRDGKKVDLSKLKGKIVLVHFWATWCPPCVDEIPELDRFWQRYRNNPSIALYSVSVDDSWEAVDTFRKQHPFDLPLYRDPQSKTAHKFGTTKFPETYIADRSGKVLYHLANAIDWDSAQVTDNIDALIKQ
ncbi:MAG TPA: TlpA disulfide reductase family protein [Thermoanaerobaculia bacterium]|nr:TlpA disulfide reductase family protein [Thermoanaerobaculia bacterium]